MNSLYKTLVVSVVLSISGCASYSITEQEMTDYLNQNLAVNQSVGLDGLMRAEIALDDVAIKIGQDNSERIAVYANTNALLKFINSPNMSLDLNVEFSAIPHYEHQSGEIFLKSLRLEKFEDNSKQLPAQLSLILQPAVSLVGQVLSNQPVYQLDSSKMEQALLKSASPELVVEKGKLVIDLL